MYDHVPHLELIISDTGMGIPQDKLIHIFDRFYQVNYNQSGYVEGSGIGLSIVKELVELLGGQIWVDSSLEKGTTFRILIPIHQKSTEAPSAISTALILDEGTPNAGRTSRSTLLQACNNHKYCLLRTIRMSLNISVLVYNRNTPFFLPEMAG